MSTALSAASGVVPERVRR